MELVNNVSLVLEKRGGHYRDNAKHHAAKRVITAVDTWGDSEPWAFHVNQASQVLAVELRHLIGRAQQIRDLRRLHAFGGL